MKVAVLKETAPGERRVALVPEMVGRLKGAGLDVLVESGAGEAAWFGDAAYAEADATISRRPELVSAADIILTVTKPDDALLGALRSGQAVIGMLNPLADPALAAALAARGVTAISLRRVPRTLSRAQPMDALSSQATIAGYKAAIVAAAPRPILADADDRRRHGPAGRGAGPRRRRSGPAGHRDRPSARRGGIRLRRPTGERRGGIARRHVRRPGPGGLGGREGGYARALTDDERPAQQAELIGHIARYDVVITTAQVPGRRPPLMVTEAASADAAGLGRGRHRGRPARRQRRRVGPGRDDRHRRRGDRHRGGQPGGGMAPAASPPTRATSPACCRASGRRPARRRPTTTSRPRWSSPTAGP